MISIRRHPKKQLTSRLPKTDPTFVWESLKEDVDFPEDARVTWGADDVLEADCAGVVEVAWVGSLITVTLQETFLYKTNEFKGVFLGTR